MANPNCRDGIFILLRAINFPNYFINRRRNRPCILRLNGFGAPARWVAKSVGHCGLTFTFERRSPHVSGL